MTLGTEVGLSSGDFVLDGDPAPFPKRDGAPPQFLVYFYCGQTAGCIQMPLGMEVGVRPGDFVLHGDQIVPPQIGGGAPSPIFGPCLLRSNGCIDQDDTWYGGRPQPRGRCVRWGPSPPLTKKGAEPPPQFSAYVYYGQTAGWIKMVVGMVVGFGPGHIVLDGDPAPLPKKVCRAPRPIFGSFLLWPNGWMDQDATCCGGTPQPRRLCIRWAPSPPHEKGAEPPPQSSAHVYCGQTATWIQVHLVRR